MATSVLPGTGASTVAPRAEPAARAIPWHLAAVVAGATSIVIGVIWDISWHMTIGRDTFWTPAHLAIYLGGTLAGLSCGARVLARSFGRATADPTDGVRLWRWFSGPLGGWICIWGALAMLTSAPFDDWWHNAYGLDVQILSPPHSLLALGMFAIALGAVVMASAAQNTEGASDARASVVAYASGVLLTVAAIMFTEYTDVEAMHGSTFYLVCGAVFPIALSLAGRASRLRWPATTAALVYTAIMAAQVWIFPLFPATPKLGPIGHEVTHMVPMDFPLLLVVPAAAIDLVLRRLDGKVNDWVLSAIVGVTFLVAFLAAQWPFAMLLASEVGRHPFFGGGYGQFSLPPEFLVGPRELDPDQGGVAATLGRVALWGTPIAIVAARFGLWRGAWLREVKR